VRRRGIPAFDQAVRRVASSIGVLALVVAGLTLESRLAPPVPADLSPVAGTTPVAVTSTQTPCLDVVWVGARGSGESFDTWQGLGPMVRQALSLYAAQMGGRRVGRWAVNYPAEHVKVLLTHRRRYFDGLDAGYKATRLFLQARHKMCPKEHYVLAGYSQGPW